MILKKQFYRLLGVVLLGLASSHPLSAQGDSRTLEFSAISFDVMPRDLWYQSGAELIPLEVGGSVRGAELSYTGPIPIQFFRKVTGEDGKVRHIPEAEALVPQGVQKALFCFFPQHRAEGGAWHVYVMDDGARSFGGGDIRFVNLSKQAIAGVLDEDTVRLKPGEQQTVTPEAGARGIGIKLAAYLDEGWEPFFSARWPYRGNVRLMILFLPDPATGKVRMQAVPQRFTPPSGAIENE